MTATMFTEFGTPYQRLIHQEMRNPFSSWVNGPSDSTLIRMDSAFNTPFRLTFHGDGLFFNGTTFGGTVDRIEVVRVDFVPGQPLTTTKLADITALPNFNIAALVADAALIQLGEPDYTQNDILSYYGSITPGKFSGSAKKDFVDAAPGLTEIFTGKGNDVVLVGPGSHDIKMGAGKKDAVDFRNAGQGMDLDISTGFAILGADVVAVAGAKVFFGTAFDDAITGSAAIDKVFGRAGDDVIEGLGADDILHGDAGDDIIRGGKGHDVLFGDADDDILVGHGGIDNLVGGSGNDRLIGGGDTDRLLGGGQRDTLNGGKGSDDLQGGKGRDFLFGDGGRDILFGNGGNDVMTGGGAADTFMILLGDGQSGNDRITDYGIGNDKIRLEGQTEANVTVTALTGPGNQYRVAHETGGIDVTMATAALTLTIDDILF